MPRPFAESLFPSPRTHDSDRREWKLFLFPEVVRARRTYIHRRIEECMKDDKRKEETMQHLRDHFQIPHDLTSIVWDLLEATYPEHFRSHYESCEAYRTRSVKVQ
ncbi:hypothetical protein Rs2_15271 [Raphanus sativus]|nr:hypothetical protein Rs2_15271 [Raphanus sativus]